MKIFVLILVLSGNTEQSYKAGIGGVAMQEFSTLAKCQTAGKAFLGMTRLKTNRSTFVCVEK